jgi:hypothetical protein
MEDVAPGTMESRGGGETGDPAGCRIVQYDSALGVDGNYAVVGRGEPGLEKPRVYRVHAAGSKRSDSPI